MWIRPALRWILASVTLLVSGPFGFAQQPPDARPNVPSQHRLEGVNLMPYLAGEMTGSPHERLLWRAGGGAKFAVREGDWKLDGENPSQLQLFNLASDVGESTDLAAQQPETVTRLRRAYDDCNQHNIAPLFESPRPNAANKGSRSNRKS